MSGIIEAVLIWAKGDHREDCVSKIGSTDEGRGEFSPGQAWIALSWRACNPSIIGSNRVYTQKQVQVIIHLFRPHFL